MFLIALNLLKDPIKLPCDAILANKSSSNNFVYIAIKFPQMMPSLKCNLIQNASDEKFNI